MCGTPMATAPAEVAEARPGGESSMATQSAMSTPRRSAAVRYGSGCGLRLGDLVARDELVEGVERDRRDDVLGHRPDRHRDERGAACPPRAARRSSSRAPGRHGTPCELSCSRTRSVSRSTMSSASRSTPRALEDRRRRSQRPAPTSCRRVLVGSRCRRTTSTSSVFGGHPVRLGVDEGAVHVPEDGGGKASGHNGQFYGHVLLWR